MPSNSKHVFEDNKADIEQLWIIHEDYAGQGRGRKRGVEVLNRSAIIFVTACWESYIEDLAVEAFDYLLLNAQDSTAIPNKVKSLAVKVLREDKNPLQIWEIADGGWRDVVKRHKGEVHKAWLEKFNTPKTAQVNGLFENMIGLSQLSSHWRWKKMSALQSEAALDDFITIRGNIAHRIRDAKPVAKNTGTRYLTHVSQIVDRCEVTVSQHLKDLTGAAPW